MESEREWFFQRQSGRARRLRRISEVEERVKTAQRGINDLAGKSVKSFTDSKDVSTEKHGKTL